MTYILWNGVYKGKVGGAFWDLFLVSAHQGYGKCYLIDATSVAEAKLKLSLVQATTFANVFVYGSDAILALTSQKGKVI